MKLKNLLQSVGLAACLALGSGCGDNNSNLASDAGLDTVVDTTVDQALPDQSPDFGPRPDGLDKTGYVHEIGPDEFVWEVNLASLGLPVCVDFYSNNCGPCLWMKPYFKNFAETYVGIKFVAFNIDHDYPGDKAIYKQHGVTAIPTFDFYLNGENLAYFRVIGADPDWLESNLDTMLKVANIDGGVVDSGADIVPAMPDMGIYYPSPPPKKDSGVDYLPPKKDSGSD